MPIRSVEEIARKAAAADTGFCNPTKIKLAAENRESAVEEIMDRGWSRDEAEQMIRDAE